VVLGQLYTSFTRPEALWLLLRPNPERLSSKAFFHEEASKVSPYPTRVEGIYLYRSREASRVI
jgi:hypothetical protein